MRLCVRLSENNSFSLRDVTRYKRPRDKSSEGKFVAMIELRHQFLVTDEPLYFAIVIDRQSNYKINYFDHEREGLTSMDIFTQRIKRICRIGVFVDGIADNLAILVLMVQKKMVIDYTFL